MQAEQGDGGLCLPLYFITQAHTARSGVISLICSKVLLLKYATGLRVVITSANLTERQFNNMTQSAEGSGQPMVMQLDGHHHPHIGELLASVAYGA